MTKISFHGEHGAYSESAAKKFFSKEINTIPCNSFEDALKITENILIPTIPRVTKKAA